MNEEVTPTNNSEQRITIDRPIENTGKSKARVEAGKRLAAFNKMVRNKKESGEVTEPKELEHHEESTCDEGMSDTTKTILLLGAVGLGYYIYTTSISNGKEENKKNVQQPVIQSNIQENTVRRLRSFKN